MFIKFIVYVLIVLAIYGCNPPRNTEPLSEEVVEEIVVDPSEAELVEDGGVLLADTTVQNN
jgi:hypothetical protein